MGAAETQSSENVFAISLLIAPKATVSAQDANKNPVARNEIALYMQQSVIRRARISVRADLGQMEFADERKALAGVKKVNLLLCHSLDQSSCILAFGSDSNAKMATVYDRQWKIEVWVIFC